MRLRALPLVFAFASLASLACSDDEPTVYPESGTWNHQVENVENNTCPASLGVLPLSPIYLIDYDGGDGFQIEMGDIPDVVCNLTGGQNFVCPERVEASSDVPEFNVTIELRHRIEGVFDSDDEAHGEHQISYTCTGEGCGALDEYPCSYQLPFTAEFQQ
jgi:hypothetical protein